MTLFIVIAVVAWLGIGWAGHYQAMKELNNIFPRDGKVWREFFSNIPHAILGGILGPLIWLLL